MVVAVLGEVAELAGRLDLEGAVDASTCREVLELGNEPVVGLLGELLCLGHAERVARAPGGPTVGPTHNPVD